MKCQYPNCNRTATWQNFIIFEEVEGKDWRDGQGKPWKKCCDEHRDEPLEDWAVAILFQTVKGTHGNKAKHANAKHKISHLMATKI